MLVLEPTTTRSRLKNTLIAQSIAVVFFVVAQIVITLMAPLSTIEFEKSGAGAVVVLHRYILIAIPWRTERVENVTRIRADITDEMHYRDTISNRRKGRIGTRLATAELAIIGDGPEVTVQADPDLATAVSAKFDAFVKSEAAKSERIQLFASWGLSNVLGGVATFFCALYVFGATVASARFLVKQARRPR